MRYLQGSALPVHASASVHEELRKLIAYFTNDRQRGLSELAAEAPA